MLKIGEFASLSSISIHMLRHYDKIGMLIPQYVDEYSGYRYYDIGQLVQANQIVSLKTMGFGLDDIKKALTISHDELEVLLREQLKSKLEEAERIEQQMKAIEKTIHFEENSEEYALSVVVKRMPRMHVVSYRGDIAKFNEEGILWTALQNDCEKYKISVSAKNVIDSRIVQGFIL